MPNAIIPRHRVPIRRARRSNFDGLQQVQSNGARHVKSPLRMTSLLRSRWSRSNHRRNRRRTHIPHHDHLSRLHLRSREPAPNRRKWLKPCQPRQPLTPRSSRRRQPPGDQESRSRCDASRCPHRFRSDQPQPHRAILRDHRPIRPLVHANAQPALSRLNQCRRFLRRHRRKVVHIQIALPTVPNPVIPRHRIPVRRTRRSDLQRVQEIKGDGP